MGTTPSTPAATGPSGYYVWEPAGKDYAVHLYPEIIDRLNYEVMKGFGALPKRGAEVGGVLLGSVERGAKLVVRVQEFESIHCEHLLGPSYVLSEKDLLELDRVLEQSAKAEVRELRVVGFFRSITRESIQLTEQDLALLDARFPDDGSICLLVKPYSGRPNEAVVLCRENGAFPSEPQTRTFVFRRKEMGVGGPPPRERDNSAAQPAAPPRAEEVPAAAAERVQKTPAEDAGPRPEAATESPVVSDDAIAELLSKRHKQRVSGAPAGGAAHEETPNARDSGRAAAERSTAGVLFPEGSLAQAGQASIGRPPVKRSRWVWVPLSFIFLVLGVVLGFEVGLGFYRAQNLALTGDPYAIDLSVSRFGDSYHIKWNPESVAVRSARRGELTVEEAGSTKPLALTTEDLARGGLIYRSEDAQRFRLTLFLRDHSSFTETFETQPAR